MVAFFMSNNKIQLKVLIRLCYYYIRVEYKVVNTKKQNIIFIVISILILIVIVISFTYAFFSANITANGNINVSVSIDRTPNPIFTATPSGDLILNITDADMLPSEANNETTPLTANETMIVTLLGGSYSEQVTCTFDFVWAKLSDSDTYVPSSGRGSLKENTLSIIDDSSTTVLFETNIDSFTNGGTIASSSISSHGVLNTKTYTITQSFYNLNLNQTMYEAVYKSRISVENISCTLSNYSQLLTSYLAADAPKSGTDAVSNSPWILTSDHEGELRYAGKNPDNYIEFNGELWRIIGVMPNMEYCTGTYGNANECDTTTTGSLVKIIRNQTISSITLRWDYKQTNVGSSTSTNGSNDWSDSQLMLMLNGTNYLKTGYDVNGNKLHQSYTITSNVVAGNGYNFYNATYSYLDGNGTTVNIPSSATTSSYAATIGSLYKKIESSALSKIATVKWDLYGTNSFQTAAQGSPTAFYNKERNINNSGTVYVNASLLENRAVYWYGKVGLIYPSDYGYATYGGNTYNRNACLEYQMYGWDTGSYQTDCAGGSFLWYNNITSTAPGTSGYTQFTISPRTDYADTVFYVNNTGRVSGGYGGILGVRPVLYLNANTTITGGSGTWNDPYTIGSPEPKTYWFPTTLSTWNDNTNQYEPTYTYPATGGIVQTSGQATGHNVYIGQDNSKYYACLNVTASYLNSENITYTFQGTSTEVCLSQPYTQYGLSGHTLNDPLTSAEKASAIQAIYQAFIDAGISVDIDNNCDAYDYYATCSVGNRNCEVGYNGYVNCYVYSEGVHCEVDPAGRAFCVS